MSDQDFGAFAGLVPKASTPTVTPAVPAQDFGAFSSLVPGATKPFAGLGDSQYVAKLNQVAKNLGIGGDDLARVIHFESNHNPQSVNAQSGATGLLQFLPSTAKGLGTSTDAIRSMSASDQLDLVEKYLRQNGATGKKFSDLYASVLYPAAVGKPDSYGLFSKGTKAYAQNAGLDKDHDGVVTKGEAAAAAYGKGYVDPDQIPQALRPVGPPVKGKVRDVPLGTNPSDPAASTAFQASRILQNPIGAFIPASGPPQVLAPDSAPIAALRANSLPFDLASFAAVVNAGAKQKVPTNQASELVGHKQLGLNPQVAAGMVAYSLGLTSAPGPVQGEDPRLAPEWANPRDALVVQNLLNPKSKAFSLVRKAIQAGGGAGAPMSDYDQALVSGAGTRSAAIIKNDPGIADASILGLAGRSFAAAMSPTKVARTLAGDTRPDSEIGGLEQGLSTVADILAFGGVGGIGAKVAGGVARAGAEEGASALLANLARYGESKAAKTTAGNLLSRGVSFAAENAALQTVPIIGQASDLTAQNGKSFTQNLLDVGGESGAKLAQLFDPRIYLDPNATVAEKTQAAIMQAALLFGAKEAIPRGLDALRDSPGLRFIQDAYNAKRGFPSVGLDHAAVEALVNAGKSEAIRGQSAAEPDRFGLSQPLNEAFAARPDQPVADTQMGNLGEHLGDGESQVSQVADEMSPKSPTRRPNPKPDATVGPHIDPEDARLDPFADEYDDKLAYALHKELIGTEPKFEPDGTVSADSLKDVRDELMNRAVVEDQQKFKDEAATERDYVQELNDLAYRSGVKKRPLSAAQKMSDKAESERIAALPPDEQKKARQEATLAKHRNTGDTSIGKAYYPVRETDSGKIVADGRNPLRTIDLSGLPQDLAQAIYLHSVEQGRNHSFVHGEEYRRAKRMGGEPSIYTIDEVINREYHPNDILANGFDDWAHVNVPRSAVADFVSSRLSEISDAQKRIAAGKVRLTDAEFQAVIEYYDRLRTEGDEPSDHRTSAERGSASDPVAGSDGGSSGVQEPPQSVDPAPEPQHAGPRNAERDVARFERGTAPVEMQSSTKVADADEAGRKAVAEGFDHVALAESIAEKPRVISQEEVGKLQAGFENLDREANRLANEIKKAQSAGADTTELRAQYEKTIALLDQNDQAMRRAGREQSAAFRQRRRRFDPANAEQALQEARLKTADGKLSQKAEAHIRDLSEKLAESERKLAETKASHEELQSRIAANEEIVRARKSRRKQDRTAIVRDIKELGAKFKEASAANEVLPEGEIRLNSGVQLLTEEQVQILKQMAHKAVEYGKNTLEEVADFVKEHLPEEVRASVSDRDVRDALSGYGHEKPPRARTEAQAKLAELKSMARLVSQIDDALGGKGRNTRGPRFETETVKQLRESLIEVEKLQGLTHTPAADPVRDLKRSIGKALDVLEYGQPDRPARIPDSPEAAALREELANIRKEIVDKYGGRPTKPIGERVKTIETRLAEIEKQTAEGYRPVKKRKPATPAEIQQARASLNEAKRKQTLTDSISDLEEQLRTGDFKEPKQRSKSSDAVAKLEAERDLAAKLVKQAIENQRPQGFFEKARTIGRALRLTNPTARVFDVVSNAVVTLDRQVGKASEAAIDNLLFGKDRATDGAANVGWSYTRAKEVADGAPARWVDEWKEQLLIGDQGLAKKIGSRDLRSGQEWLNKSVNFINRFAGTTDVPFKDAVFEGTLRDMAESKARVNLGKGATKEAITAERNRIVDEAKAGTAHQEMVTLAENEAIESVFGGDNVLATALDGATSNVTRKFGDSGHAALLALDLVAPFPRLFTNLTKYVTDFGAGAVKAGNSSLKIAARARSGGEGFTLTERRVINRLVARNLRGLAYAYVGYLAYQNGMLKPKVDEQGRYADFGDLENVGGPMTVVLYGATLAAANEQQDPEVGKKLIRNTTIGLMANQPLIEGPSKFLQTLSYNPEKAVGQKLSSALIPGLIREWAKRQDQVRNGVGRRKTDSLLSSFQANIPFARESLEPAP